MVVRGQIIKRTKISAGIQQTYEFHSLKDRDYKAAKKCAMASLKLKIYRAEEAIRPGLNIWQTQKQLGMIT